MKIHFFHTNDVHSHFEEYLQVATQLRRSRADVLAKDETAFTFDMGDHADRKRMETEGTFGRTNAALLREVGYDAWVFGNNEGLTLPKERWEELVNEAGIPALNANLFDEKTREPYPFFDPYLILEREGVRIGVIGLTVPFFDFYKMFEVYVEHPRDTFARLLPELRAQEVDLIVLLSHLGLNSDRQIAEEIEGIDIILGGHSHHLLEQPERIGHTLICQTGCYGEGYGHLIIEWDAQQRRIVSTAGGTVKRDPQVTPDRDLREMLDHWQERAAEELTTVVAEVPDTLEHALYGDSPIAHLLTNAMRRLSGAPIALINAGMFNHGLLAGAVTKEDLLTCFPSPCITCVVDLTGTQLLSLLRKSLDPAYVERVGRGYGFRGHLIGGLQVSGLEVHVTPRSEEESEQEFDLHAFHLGQPLDPEARYEVAGIDYLYFSQAYEEFREGRNVRFFLPFLRELLAEALVKLDPREWKEIHRSRWHFEGQEEGE